ncbi:thiolase family protein [Aciditerrimonas ferrireducens]|nr:thiolase family protein [Aciditerrimonas ferrireducens]MCK4176251.1 thiolase family protein [Aciditerrimonas ferrireducens]
MTRSVRVVGAAMTPMSTRDRSVEELSLEAATGALADADLEPRGVGLVVAANATGGRLLDQGCIRGQTWLRRLGLGGAPVVNVDNSCAGGSSALHLAVLAASAGQGPVLAVGVEKMWTGDRSATLAAIEDGLPADERAGLRDRHPSEAGSVLMGFNASWVRRQLERGWATVRQIAAAAAKARQLAAVNPFAQWRTPVSVEEVLADRPVAGPLTRAMCSSFTDGAAAVVVRADPGASGPRVAASVARSGNGDRDYHDRLAEVAQEAWKQAGLGPGDVDLVELHDATSAEELYAHRGRPHHPRGRAAGGEPERRAGRPGPPPGRHGPGPGRRGHVAAAGQLRSPAGARGASGPDGEHRRDHRRGRGPGRRARPGRRMRGTRGADR